MRTTLRASPPGPGTSDSSMTALGGSGSGEPDMALVGELLEEISRHAPAINARKLLIEHYISVGWLDAAKENAQELRRLSPKDTDVTAFLAVLSKKSEPPLDESRPATASTFHTAVTSTPVLPIRKKPPKATVQLPGNLDAARQDVSQGYKSLREKAGVLLKDLLHLQALQKKNGLQQSKNTARIQAIIEGRPTGSVLGAAQPGSARSIARLIQGEPIPEKAIELATADLENLMHWVKEPHGKPSKKSDDDVRDALVKRVHALASALPDTHKVFPEIALMHIEHENLDRNYVNEETMLGDEVKDIPRANFWVTEDNYAWDMEELAQAITVNGGVMRNPLSRQMFTPKDIRGIVTHPQGRQLAKLQVQQHEMSKGVRKETIEHMERLGKVLLQDQTSDQLPSRQAIDEFMAYIATLPELEQKAIQSLRCPAKDSHTGQSYDFTIGESVQDAKGNRVCFHKTGDFIQQAATHLRNNQGAPPDDPAKCVMM